MMKTRFYVAALAVLLALPFVMSSCQTRMPSVPDSGRKVVPPSGSTESQKSWSRMTEQEGSAAFGPLGEMSKRR